MRPRCPVSVAVLVAALFFCVTPCFAKEIRGSYVKGDVIVTLRGSYGASVFNAANYQEQAQNIAVRMCAAAPAGTKATCVYSALSAGSGRSMACLHSDVKTTSELIAALAGRGEVVSVQPNFIARAAAEPNEPAYARLLWQHPAIGTPELWDSSQGRADVVVAVVDTGVKYDHHDLISNIATISGFPADSQYSYFNNTHGAWFYSVSDDNNKPELCSVGDSSGTATYDERKLKGLSADYADRRYIGDYSGHGTHVAGIIGAAGNNGIGTAGVCWKVKLLPVNVFTMEAGVTRDSDTIRGLDFIYAANRESDLSGKIRVVNMSIGGWSDAEFVNDQSAYYAALKRLDDDGIIVCVAAGNEGQNINNPTGSDEDGPYEGRLPSPAAFGAMGLKNMLVVGNAQKSDGKITRADDSNYSNPSKKDLRRYVDVFAPGTDIFSTAPRYDWTGRDRMSDNTMYSDRNDGGYSGYQYMSGTSMATPATAGSAALLCALCPDYPAERIKDIIVSGADKNCLREGLSAYGFLDLHGSLRLTEELDVNTAYDDEGDNDRFSYKVQKRLKALGLLDSFEKFNDDGDYCYAGGLARNAAHELTDEEDRPASIFNVNPLPAFAISIDSEEDSDGGAVRRVPLVIRGKWLGDTVGNTRLMSVFGDQENERQLFTYADGGGDGTFAILSSPDLDILAGTDTLSPDLDYVISLDAADNGSFDADPGDDKILCSLVLFTVVPQQDEEAEIPDAVDADELPSLAGTGMEKSISGDGGGSGPAGSSGSSGGCGAGFSSVLSLLALVPVLLRRRGR